MDPTRTRQPTRGDSAAALTSERTAAATSLRAALATVHIPLAAEATAPYEARNTGCPQTDVAIQEMKAAKVNFVFLLAQNLCAASLVEGTQKAGDEPDGGPVGLQMREA